LKIIISKFVGMKRCVIIFCSAILVFLLGEQGYTQAEAKPPVRNIILMIGDGMGVAHITSLMLDNGYDNHINMDRATGGGLVQTYSLNNRVTDSAASATAYATGSKTKNSRLGVDVDGNPLETIIEKGISQRGMSGGVVATIGLNHATPAAFYAHSISRRNYYDIALDILSTPLTVAIGGGRKYFENRSDGINIIDTLRSRGYTIGDKLEDLDGVTAGKAMVVYPGGTSAIPSIGEGRDPEYLPRATAKALEILSDNRKGFFLMVEGSKIDGFAHRGDVVGVVAETRDFDNAVGVAFDYADAHSGTLVIVLADHETGGLALPSGDVDFLKGESGVSMKFATTGHTGSMVPLLTYGTGSELFGGIMNNDELGRRMQQVLGLK
jgi:alkaline phosphatase